MNIRKAVIALIAVAVAAGIWALVSGASGTQTRLAPAWQLTPASVYSGSRVVDPFVSWSPDSRSLLFSVRNYKPRKNVILKWNVGEKQVKLITEGVSPNYLKDADKFIYLRQEPPRVFVRSLKTGEEKEVMTAAQKGELWKDVTAVNYDPADDTVAARLTYYTRYEMRGTDLYDLDGRALGDVVSDTNTDRPALSHDPAGSECAVIVRDAGGPMALKITSQDLTGGRAVARGYLGAVDWSPRGEMVAYGDSASVLVVRPEDGRRVTVGGFGPPVDKPDGRYVSRLKWSPNGYYLAVLVYVPSDGGDYPLLYVLDLSNFKWER